MIAATLALALAAAQSAQVQFKFEDAKLQPSSYTLQINEDGSGIYTQPTGTPQPIHIQKPLLTEIFQSARSHHLFDTTCEAPHSRVAFTGNKTLTYTGPEGHGSCTFNYSHDEKLNQLAADLMAVAYTLQQGAILARDHRYDRLGLDADLEALEEAAKDQRALEIENIAPELESIAGDESVMNLARNQARKLLETTQH